VWSDMAVLSTACSGRGEPVRIDGSRLTAGLNFEICDI
jgi:hypothetical protein